MFEEALKAKITIVGAVTDDLIHAPLALKLISGEEVLPYPSKPQSPSKLSPCIYYTTDPEIITVENYKKLLTAEKQLVYLNPDKPSPLVFNAGVLPTPPQMISGYLQEFVDGADMDPLLVALRGLSLKAVQEIVQITMVRTGGVALPDIRRTRATIGGTIQGLTPVDTDVDFYVFPGELEVYLQINESYFKGEKVPFKLVPRGILCAGPPGVGKTMAAKAVANQWKIPLFRLDISTALDKYIGVSETNVANSLAMVDRESPCVLLIDEVEKLFTNSNDDSGVTVRILGQLLWWLQDHRSRVFTVMTTNKINALPHELYRPGRMDRVITLAPLSMVHAYSFALRVYNSILPGDIPEERKTHLLKMLQQVTKDLVVAELPHSEVAELVYGQIKACKWLPWM